MEKFTRVIQLSGDVDENMFAQFQQQLLEFEADGSQVIALYINSEGGNVRQSLAIYDLIITSKCDIVGIVVGNCYSAAFTILQACKKRYSTPHSEFMTHPGTASVEEVHLSEFIGRAATEIAGQKLSDKLSFSRIKDLKAFKRYYSKGRFFTPSKALELGVIDEVIANRFPTKG